ncbi:MAG TPA: hypothetical protein VFF12_03885, partial [Myxococcaceae bacterium]|nr:hypothetical protein [Myxococcaceae bacterium]
MQSTWWKRVAVISMLAAGAAFAQSGGSTTPGPGSTGSTGSSGSTGSTGSDSSFGSTGSSTSASGS